MTPYLIFVLILFFTSGFVLTYFLTPVISNVVKVRRLFEKRNDRSSHSVMVPSFGGISFFIVFVLALSFAEQFFTSGRAYYMIPAALIIFMIGLKDDLTGVGARNKIFGQLLATSLLFLSSDFQITELWGWLGIHHISLWISMPLAYAVVIFFINAFNLIDGIDGLSSSLGAFFFSFFAVFYFLRQDYTLLMICVSFVGMFIAFLRYNLSTDKKIFMGDTGSMFIGFILSAIVIEIMSSNFNEYVQSMQASNLPHVLIGVLYIPVFDSIRIFIARASEGKSPFTPDRTHIHHLLMDYHGWKHPKTSFMIVVLNVGIMLLVWQTSVLAPQWVVAAELLALGIILSFYLRNLRRVIGVRQAISAKKK
jgi:UDP-N-acetylmuramyl pentapeptide phosphotransferase/UDP-N-acetylglucosamine-1-phosphate transferase